MSLFDILFPPRADGLALRGLSDDDFLSLLQVRLVSGTRPGTVVLLPFHAVPVRAAIHEAKYHGSGRAIQLLALALAEYLGSANDDFRRPAIVPIPLGELRRKERGFNQAEEVARQAVKHLSGFTVETSILKRTRETVSQVSLPRHKREENMRGAFSASPDLDPARTYIVVDDVLTTGATLQAAIDALQAAGAVHIVPIALAH
ncbi:MAG: ComF family protein [Candidatus Paceibacteria bacterium]